MSEFLPYDEIEMWKYHLFCFLDKLGNKLNTPYDIDFGYFVEVDLKYPDEIKRETKNISILSWQ